MVSDELLRARPVLVKIRLLVRTEIHVTDEDCCENMKRWMLLLSVSVSTCMIVKSLKSLVGYCCCKEQDTGCFAKSMRYCPSLYHAVEGELVAGDYRKSLLTWRFLERGQSCRASLVYWVRNSWLCIHNASHWTHDERRRRKKPRMKWQLPEPAAKLCIRISFWLNIDDRVVWVKQGDIEGWESWQGCWDLHSPELFKLHRDSLIVEIHTVFLNTSCMAVVRDWDLMGRSCCYGALDKHCENLTPQDSLISRARAVG